MRNTGSRWVDVGMDVLCRCISLWRVYQVVTLGRIEGNFGITVQSEAFCTEHILAQELWTYQNLAFDVSKLHIIAYTLYFVWFNFAKFHVICLFWNYVSIELCWTMSIESLVKQLNNLIFWIIYLLNCKYIQKYMVFICNLKPRWWWF